MYKKNKWTIWIISVLLISIALDLSAQEKQPNVVFILADDLAVVEISGKELKELLNYSLQLTYGFAQFSGLTMEYDSSLPNGQRLLKAKVNKYNFASLHLSVQLSCRDFCKKLR